MLERALAPQPGEFDWGFKLQFMYGSDARFIHSLGLFSNTAATSIVQPDLVEAYLNLHFPIITEGGLDLKLGKFVTLEGAETIDPRTNFFYSHTYIFNFGIPFNHTGAPTDLSRDQMARSLLAELRAALTPASTTTTIASPFTAASDSTFSMAN